MNPTSSFDAVLFDLDGVLTSTAALHAAAWKRTFDPLLTLWGQEPFDLERDYLDHVDGRPAHARLPPPPPREPRAPAPARGLTPGDTQ